MTSAWHFSYDECLAFQLAVHVTWKAWGTKLRASLCLFCSFIDATYADPLGEAPVRPKTAGRQRPQQVEDEFGDEEIGDDLLPE